MSICVETVGYVLAYVFFHLKYGSLKKELCMPPLVVWEAFLDSLFVWSADSNQKMRNWAAVGGVAEKSAGLNLHSPGKEEREWKAG